MNKNVRIWTAEFIGTFTLIFIGCGSICMNQLSGNALGLLGIAVAHGLAIGVMVSALGHISGAKFNPAVSLGLVAGGKQDIMDAIPEIISQLAGAVVAAMALRLIFPENITTATHLGTQALGGGIGMGTGILAEAILTFLLVLTVYATAVDPAGSFKSIAGLGIGGIVLIDHLVGISVTGASMNPARTFGPALVSGYWDNHLVYWIGPILGGVAAGLLYTKVLTLKKSGR